MWATVVQAREAGTYIHGDGCEQGDGVETALHEDSRGLDELKKDA